MSSNGVPIELALAGLVILAIVYFIKGFKQYRRDRLRDWEERDAD